MLHRRHPDCSTSVDADGRDRHRHRTSHTDLAGAECVGGWFMYWKSCAMAELVNVVTGCWVASADSPESDCPKTDDAHAAQAILTAKARRFIESSFLLWARSDSPALRLRV
ncbi:hypothetical protein [Paraburkholderia fynbosensis]|uniref:Uncharacterized protein n=1 Tax=Paraburkholderia fynbosensis TaxID=1200993 RepID=A0A6J5FHJ8_9BURK|nr:hypothetical protein [Paraburkholderia fynbosensis]CAB3780387.1 hypothetical protein LMG27177_00908 [Paraburkholderia fynbosensis]